ncbi:MAG: aminotransferase class V-fold PLP-dependent enzyme [Planctomycetes bacterium]|nr:aminotransferase class V-fold PLP-dependent enzyme [Planctomycetota bacterium]
MDDIVYLDNNATTRPLDSVVEAMGLMLAGEYANPSSLHRFGQSVRHRMECARAQVASLVGADPREIVFTAGGTESINLAIRGTLSVSGNKRHLVTSTVEHSAVRNLARQLRREGYDVTEVGVDRSGRLDLDRLTERLRDDTALISVMYANNETGVVFDVESVAALAAERDIPLHLDAVQAVGKVGIDLARLPATLMSISAHKFHGPKGAGALYVRRGARLRSLQYGGRQERDLRPGTENVPAIIGMGVAAEAVANELADGASRVAQLRDRLEAGLRGSAPRVHVNGHGAPRLPNTTNIAFPGVRAEALLLTLSEHGICASSGAACSSGALEPSHVLQAMGLEAELIDSSLRFSLSSFTTDEEVDCALSVIPPIVARLAAIAGNQ